MHVQLLDKTVVLGTIFSHSLFAIERTNERLWLFRNRILFDNFNNSNSSFILLLFIEGTNNLLIKGIELSNIRKKKEGK